MCFLIKSKVSAVISMAKKTCLTCSKIAGHTHGLLVCRKEKPNEKGEFPMVHLFKGACKEYEKKKTS